MVLDPLRDTDAAHAALVQALDTVHVALHRHRG
jgi:hypothetical protein